MKMYQHLDLDGNPIALKPGKVVCVGRNYREHCAELDNEVPKMPLLFMKPESSLIQSSNIEFSCDEPIHYEAELALLIGHHIKQGQLTDESSCWDAVIGLGVALDLTKRGLQSKLKAKGHPWELAKAFDASCPVSGFSSEIDRVNPIRFSMTLNEALQQEGNTQQMIHSIPSVLQYMNKHFSLKPGDVVLTGTPEGVGEIKDGDQMTLSLNEQQLASFSFSYHSN
jgi:2-keto-4-pentenoate hydratase/2-oxohepta-3-ene-1,7-dioic acid hydratase in catechol pathway